MRRLDSCTTNTPSAPCTEHVKVISAGGNYPTEVTWGIRYNGNVVLSGKGGETKYICLSEGLHEVYGKDIYGDSWDGAYLSILGESVDGSPRGVYLAGWTGPRSEDGTTEVKTNIVIGSGRQQNTFVDLVHGLQQEVESLRKQLTEPQKYLCEVATKFCAPGTKWIDGKCVASFNGIVSACENARPGWEWTCKAAGHCMT